MAANLQLKQEQKKSIFYSKVKYHKIYSILKRIKQKTVTI